MFKNIQKSLLIKHPLLWNTKIVPLFCIMTVFHIIFFVIGYFDGAIDFSEIQNPFSFNFDREVVIFFSILTSILSMIIWLVFYFKNNAFKSFYPKSKFSLYKEWLLQLLACLLICGFTASYFYGKDVRARSYFSEEEAIRRCDIIRSASMFTMGSFENDEFITVDSAGYDINIRKDYTEFNGRKYSLNSLMNKNIETFAFFDHENDSLQKKHLRTLLANNQKDSVKQIFKKVLELAKEHRLAANINKEKWIDLVFNYPDFEQRYIVGNSYRVYDSGFADYAIEAAENTQKKDSLNLYWKVIDGQEVAFNKHYVPLNQLKYGYEKVADGYENPDVDTDFLFVMIYFAIGFSILIFSFRVTSGRNWLIALVSIGILNMVFGLFTITFRFRVTYQLLLLLLFISVLLFFLFVLRRKTEKGISGILLNIILWLTPAFIPLLYFLVLEIVKLSCGYYAALIFNGQREKFPTIDAMEQNMALIFYLNVLFIFLAMLFLSIKIKKWKGIAED